MAHSRVRLMRNVTSVFFFSSRRRHTRWPRDWSSDVCSSDLLTTRRGSQRASGPHLQAELLLEQGDVLGRAHAVLHEAQSAVGIDREGGTDGALHDPAVHVLLAPGPVGAHEDRKSVV